jgi:hypothetical protein
MTDPIVEEVRKIRDEHAARFNYDIDAIFEDLKRREKESGQPVVTLQPKRIVKPRQASDRR